MRKKSILILSILILSTLVIGCSDVISIEEAEKRYLRTDKGEGGIKVEVTWGSDEYYKAKGEEMIPATIELDDQLVFEVSMDAHSGDLRTYPVLEMAELIIDGKSSKAVNWDITANQAHHLKGILTFTKPEGFTAQLSDSELELRLKDLGNIPSRSFKW